MTDKKDIAKRYDSSAEIYDNRYRDIQNQKYQEILSRVDLTKSEMVLDVGCGTGRLLEIINGLREGSSPLIGIDISFEMIKIAHKKFPEGHFIVADSDFLPFRGGTFDSVFSVTHLQNIPKPLETVKEMHRVSKKEAKIVISILRKSWSFEKLEQILSEVELEILERWAAEVEDIGVVCSKK